MVRAKWQQQKKKDALGHRHTQVNMIWGEYYIKYSSGSWKIGIRKNKKIEKGFFPQLVSKDTGTIHLCVLLLSLSQAARESENEKKNLFAPQRKSVDWKWATATAAIFFFSHWCIWLKSEACKIHGLFPLPFSIFSTQENFLMCQFCICCQLPFKMSEKKGELFKVQIRSVEVKRVCHANGPKRTWCMHSRKKAAKKGT